MTELILFGGFALFLVLNVPIGFALGLAVLGYLASADSTFPLRILSQTMVTACDSFPLMAVPFFILAGAVMEGGGLSRRLVDFAESIMGHVTGGLAMVTVLTCMFFGAISGSSPATVAAIGAIMIPAMVSKGYPPRFAVGLAAVAGGLGVIIPPSIPMVVYGVATNESVGYLFLGGFGPGVICGFFLMAVSYYISRREGYLGSGRPFALREVMRAGNAAKWALLVPIIILGGIYGGVFTPTEAAVVAVFYGIVAGKYIYKELSWASVNKHLVDSAVMVASILIIVGTATTLGKIMTAEQIPEAIARGLLAFTDSKLVFLVLINCFLLVVGCIMDTLGAILILGPILAPVAAQYGVDPIHFGLIVIVNLAVGFVTPPVGMNLFVACGLTGQNLDEVSRAVIPFAIAMGSALIFITYVPEITLAIPQLLGYGK